MKSFQTPMLRLVPLVVVTILTLWTAGSIQAQTAPAPVTTTFDESTDQDWTDPTNWDNGVPTGTPSTQTGDNAKIGDSKTALWDQQANGDPEFGTLTLGTGSTLLYKANGNQGLPEGSEVYFSDGSTLRYTAGSSNRNDNFRILPGADATFETAGNTFFRGTMQGSGDLDVLLNGNFEMRRNLAGFTGDLTITNAGTSDRRVWFRRFGAGSDKLGEGVNTIGDNLWIQHDRQANIPDVATLKLDGGPGTSRPKWRLTHNETVQNLIIDSPTQTVPYLITGNSTNSGSVRATDMATFQGTAGTVDIESQMGGEFQGDARRSGVDINAGNMMFQGTGDWTINGSKNTGGSTQPENFAIGSIGIADGGDVTTDTNATVNAAFSAPNGFTKEGDATLTLNHTDPVRNVQGGTEDFNVKGDVIVNAGTLVVNNTFFTDTVNVNSGGTLGGTGIINGVVTVAGTHAAGASPGIQTFTSDLNYSGGSSVVEWDLIDNTISGRGTNFDGIDVGGDLDFADPTSMELVFDGSGSSVDWTDGFWGTSKTGTDGWLVYDVEGTTSNFSNLSIASSDWADGSGNLFNTERMLSSFSLFQDGSDIYLNYTAIPEPSRALLTGLGVMILFMRRRRK